jgi:4'-phosphopantetheinyl transferase
LGYGKNENENKNGIADNAEWLTQANTLLSFDELVRVKSFVFETHRRRYSLTRIALRQVLGEHLNIAAQHIRFRYSAAGQPQLDMGTEDVFFSVSHSDDYALIAVSRGTPIGVDLERLKPGLIDLAALAQCFTQQEQEALSSVASPHRETAFYRCWVRKEALLKALGLGLPGGLLRFAVSVGDSAQLLWADPTLTLAAHWSILSLDAPAYAAALAFEI